MQDIFNDPAFNMANLTASINILPNLYGRVGEMGLFAVKPITTRSVIIEEKHGTLNLLQSKPLGSPGTVDDHGARTVRSFVVPHIPHDDIVLPGDVAGIRAFGSETELETVSSIVNDRLQTMKNKHDITHEWHRMGALKGQILDADGSMIYDLYSEFGITKKTVNFALGTATTDVKAKCLAVKRHIQKNLMGELMKSVRVLVSEEFFDALTSHANVEKAFANWQEAQNRLGGDMRTGFDFGGLTFEEYAGEATDSAGTLRRFIAAGSGHAFPEGTGVTFHQYAAPADFNETVNTLGQVYYAKQEPRDMGRGTNIHTQSNPLALCLRPGVLVECTAA